MDSFEFTKIAAGVLSALLLIFGTKTLIEMQGHGGEKPGYTLPMPDESGESPAEAKAVEPEVDVMSLLASADADKGKSQLKKCTACHVNEKGKAHTVGPNLYGVVNRPIASIGDFSYSQALKEKGADKSWTFEELSHFLEKPSDYAPGTKMNFRGFKKPKDLADIIAYLATLADTPVELPAPKADTAEEAPEPAADRTEQSTGQAEQPADPTPESEPAEPATGSDQPEGENGAK